MHLYANSTLSSRFLWLSRGLRTEEIDAEVVYLGVFCFKFHLWVIIAMSLYRRPVVWHNRCRGNIIRIMRKQLVLYTQSRTPDQRNTTNYIMNSSFVDETIERPSTYRYSINIRAGETWPRTVLWRGETTRRNHLLERPSCSATFGIFYDLSPDILLKRKWVLQWSMMSL